MADVTDHQQRDDGEREKLREIIDAWSRLAHPWTDLLIDALVVAGFTRRRDQGEAVTGIKCCRCGVALTGACYGMGDGTGQQFGCGHCYWQSEAGYYQAMRDRAIRERDEARAEADQRVATVREALLREYNATVEFYTKTVDALRAERDALAAKANRMAKAIEIVAEARDKARDLATRCNDVASNATKAAIEANGAAAAAEARAAALAEALRDIAEHDGGIAWDASTDMVKAECATRMKAWARAALAANATTERTNG